MRFFKNIYAVWANEIKLIFKDPGVIIFFFLLPLAYPVVYTLIYNPEVLHDIPVAVVDDSRTASSRELTRMLDATSGAQVIGIASDMQQARRWMAEKKCYAVMQIPSSYGKDVATNTPVKVPIYMDMSLLLRYRTLGFAVTDIQLQLGDNIRTQLIDRAGLETAAAAKSTVNNEAIFLGDTEQGFASFIMPGIVILILQQSMVLGITMLAGGAAERRRRNNGKDPLAVPAGVTATLVGKTLAYVMLYIPAAVYVMHWLPEMFSLPHIGSVTYYLPFILPMLIASALFGILAGKIFVSEREMSFMVVVFTSVVFLFLSGLTWPRYAMNTFWLTVGDLIPAVKGVEGFIRINSNGATLAENSATYTWLWLLSAAYFILTWAVMKYTRRKTQE